MLAKLVLPSGSLFFWFCFLLTDQNYLKNLGQFVLDYFKFDKKILLKVISIL